MAPVLGSGDIPAWMTLVSNFMYKVFIFGHAARAFCTVQYTHCAAGLLIYQLSHILPQKKAAPFGVALSIRLLNGGIFNSPRQPNSFQL